ncbi:phage tail protein [Bradyrhizobium sp.]|uniref:phage tail protein n=1 Tax=Bradyrhizobium sp. TaxID=376 RepID=UPI002736E1B5|nr:tail fiber protein [Bradyrhizobium sp.]MDP3076659.1 tail fiber protein [Bradyrhizobium sp.]
MTLYKWSQTASADATADSTINWAEGQSPSSVNDSARAMMAATAKYRDDIAGAIVTAGISTAYTVSSYEVFETLVHLNGQMIAFTPHVTNGATVTLNVDSLGARPLRSAPGVELLAGTLIQGTPYVVVYNHASAAFYLHGFFGNPYNIPLGGGLPFFGPTAPNSSFVFPYGQAISRATYSALFALFGTTYGTGDGSTTFNVPDLRGRVLAGKDDMGGNPASRLTPSYFGTSAAALGAVGGGESHTLTTAQLAAHTHVNTLIDPGHAHNYGQVADAPGGSAIQSARNGTGSTTAMNTTGVTIINASAGGGGAHNNVQPTIICNYILRIV